MADTGDTAALAVHAVDAQERFRALSTAYGSLDNGALLPPDLRQAVRALGGAAVRFRDPAPVVRRPAGIFLAPRSGAGDAYFLGADRDEAAARLPAAIAAVRGRGWPEADF